MRTAGSARQGAQGEGRLPRSACFRSSVPHQRHHTGLAVQSLHFFLVDSEHLSLSRDGEGFLMQLSLAGQRRQFQAYFRSTDISVWQNLLSSMMRVPPESEFVLSLQK